MGAPFFLGSSRPRISTRPLLCQLAKRHAASLRVHQDWRWRNPRHLWRYLAATVEPSPIRLGNCPQWRNRGRDWIRDRFWRFVDLSYGWLYSRMSQCASGNLLLARSARQLGALVRALRVVNVTLLRAFHRTPGRLAVAAHFVWIGGFFGKVCRVTGVVSHNQPFVCWSFKERRPLRPGRAAKVSSRRLFAPPFRRSGSGWKSLPDIVVQPSLVFFLRKRSWIELGRQFAFDGECTFLLGLHHLTERIHNQETSVRPEPFHH